MARSKNWRKAAGVEPTRERPTPPTGFEARPHHRVRVPSECLHYTLPRPTHARYAGGASNRCDRRIPGYGPSNRITSRQRTTRAAAYARTNAPVNTALARRHPTNCRRARRAGLRLDLQGFACIQLRANFVLCSSRPCSWPASFIWRSVSPCRAPGGRRRVVVGIATERMVLNPIVGRSGKTLLLATMGVGVVLQRGPAPCTHPAATRPACRCLSRILHL